MEPGPEAKREELELNVISPLCAFVFPAPSKSCKVRFPEPEFKETPFANVITAVPGLRAASTTPLAKRSLPVIVKLPLAVSMFALMKRLLPADKDKLPPGEVEVMIGLMT